MGALEDALISKGVATREELDRLTEHFAESRIQPNAAKTRLAAKVAGIHFQSPVSSRETDRDKRFNVGDRMRAVHQPNRPHPLPRYIRADRVRDPSAGVHSFDDSKSQGSDPSPSILNVV